MGLAAGAFSSGLLPFSRVCSCLRRSADECSKTTEGIFGGSKCRWSSYQPQRKELAGSRHAMQSENWLHGSAETAPRKSASEMANIFLSQIWKADLEFRPRFLDQWLKFAFSRPPPQWGIGSRQQKQRLRAPKRRSRPPVSGWL